MSVDGTWVFEVAGIYGWERVSTVFMEKGRYLGGGAVIFSHGTYEIKGKKIKIKLNVTQHGKKQTIFGDKQKHFSSELTGKLHGDRIEGKARLEGSKSTVATYPFRLIRLAGIPALPKKS
ncbi:MAG: hypothetical protein KZQ64_11170 [gamma proteobacterium symbiont of Bathyaustriella thionipta]|nr:hypothetical protein [gamma proteobacterium symbiont of Bathyaustriella thionipta]MCU7951286.1 hypothetical protein [gamma proteobacterium symbiont of Bathyaustriella thionipta]MCU7953936.1 hypothetical protein [gamma proteobacterium symbiont of Bathyaustriella thionipta]MCU7957825.1 hypothetical protein [gamma proteobacterium symbiont of Bathyaustriella thionipta]MCU7967557.1 hypothetical protein [gamma proteobacterium symbiont of Bathyaustriella thionipta]